ncbi:sulfate transporter 3.1-like isoform X2 [Oryza brachyantha]|uniref:sulfate transporter 3.1-like isoform X2 n=1 Tax=Oryza brachyantha TaxID=4533 RepID=UPI001ADA4ADD|nr:sulfate transporter 3.1-like isoform X2 [Oryza brachyantha]
MVGQQQVADAAATAARRVPVPPAKPLLRTVGANLMEVFFPDDPFRAVARDQGGGRRALAALRYVFPFLEWLPSYTLGELWADVVAGVTVASLAVPQGISYAKLADLPPIMGLYSSFVPALVYAAMGSSRELAVGTTAVGSLLFAAMLGEEAPPGEKPELYAALAFTATFFAGALQAGLGVLRLGFVVDLLSHAAIVGFMGGAATVVCLQQLKGMLGLRHFTTSTDVVAVVRSVVTQSHLWRWQSVVLGGAILFFLLLVRFIGKRKPRLFLLSAAAPLMSVIFGSLLVYLVHGENHGIQVIGALKKGINPPSARDLLLSSPHTAVALKTGIITGIIGLAEGIAVGRSFAMLKNYNVDGNKEMVAFGLMNIVGSCTSCYLTTGPFSRSAVNSNAGSRTAMSNAVMAAAVALTLLFLTPLFHYTPLVVLSAIIISAMLGVLDFGAAARLWRVDKIDFCVCVGAYLGVVFGSIQIGLAIAVGISILRILLFAARPKTTVLGKIPSSTNFRRMDQYTAAQAVPGLLVLRIDSPIYFTNASYLRERIMRWISYEEDRIKAEGLESLKCLVLDMGAVAGMDTSGTKMLEDLKKNLDRSGVQVRRKQANDCVGEPGE